MFNLKITILALAINATHDLNSSKKQLDTLKEILCSPHNLLRKCQQFYIKLHIYF